MKTRVFICFLAALVAKASSKYCSYYFNTKEFWAVGVGEIVCFQNWISGFKSRDRPILYWQCSAPRGGGGLNNIEITFLLLTKRPWYCLSTFPKFYLDVAEIYRQLWLEESGKRLENVDPTHLVLASGKLVLQKKFRAFSIGNSSGMTGFICLSFR